jgi:uncharacterized membrane protein YphA (DoxX/SURF4 family)
MSPAEDGLPAGRRAVQPATPAAPASRIGTVSGVASGWAPTVGRTLLGVVLLWFGYHELVQPALWTGYVPVLSPSSDAAVIGVLAHGWLLLVLGVAVIAGIALRLAAAVTVLLLVEIVVALSVTAGLSDLTLRDVGVLGLAVCLTGDTRQRLALRR